MAHYGLPVLYRRQPLPAIGGPQFAMGNQANVEAVHIADSLIYY
jgi:hypothetical protein